jgi:hypothetical protein
MTNFVDTVNKNLAVLYLNLLELFQGSRFGLSLLVMPPLNIFVTSRRRVVSYGVDPTE